MDLSNLPQGTSKNIDRLQQIRFLRQVTYWFSFLKTMAKGCRNLGINYNFCVVTGQMGRPFVKAVFKKGSMEPKNIVNCSLKTRLYQEEPLVYIIKLLPKLIEKLLSFHKKPRCEQREWARSVKIKDGISYFKKV